MSDPSDPRQPPHPPRHTPPDSTSGFPATSEFPPVGAQAPGHQPPEPPSYQPGYQPSEPPGYPPPPRLPRKSAAPLVALVLAISLLLCGGVAVVGKILVDRATDKAEELAGPLLDPTPEPAPSATAANPGWQVPDWPDLPGMPALPTDLPTGVPGLGEGPEVSVTYEVTGDGPAEILYVEKMNGTLERVGSAKLPWKTTAKLKSPTLVSVVALRAGFTSGKITCRASVNGKKVAEHTAEGSVTTANCYNFFIE